jgi:hypothetical protein
VGPSLGQDEYVEGAPVGPAPDRLHVAHQLLCSGCLPCLGIAAAPTRHTD